MLGSMLLVTASLVAGQAEATAPAEDHLACLDGFLGHWVYEGPLQEDLSDMAPAGTEIVVHSYNKRILNGRVIENDWEILVQEEQVLAGKNLIAWNPKEDRIFLGGMGSDGGYAVARVTVSQDGKIWTNENKGVDPEGKDTSNTVVQTLKDPDTLTWQARNRQGGELTGDSPVYEFKRCTCEDHDEDEDDEDDEDEDEDEDGD
jgi:hypothetical protein